MTLKFLRAQTQEWKDQYVRALVSLAGAWGGAVKALKVFAVGMLKKMKYITGILLIKINVLFFF